MTTGDGQKRGRSRTGAARATVVVSPTTMSQLTCLEVAGIDARRFLELLTRHREIPRTRIGKLVIVEITAWQDAIRTLRGVRSEPEAEANTEAEQDDADFESADEVLAAIGREVAR